MHSEKRPQNAGFWSVDSTIYEAASGGLFEQSWPQMDIIRDLSGGLRGPYEGSNGRETGILGRPRKRFGWTVLASWYGVLRSETRNSGGMLTCLAGVFRDQRVEISADCLR